MVRVSCAIAIARTSPSTLGFASKMGLPRGSVPQCPVTSFLTANMLMMKRPAPRSPAPPPWPRVTTTTRGPSAAIAWGSSANRITSRSLGAGSSTPWCMSTKSAAFDGILAGSPGCGSDFTTHQTWPSPAADSGSSPGRSAAAKDAIEDTTADAMLRITPMLDARNRTKLTSPRRPSPAI